MGLAEKRAIEEYKGKEFVQIKSDIEKAAGYPLEMDIHWDTLAEPGKEAQYPQMWQKVYFGPLLDALKSVTADEMGKTALKEALKKVVVDGSEGSSSSTFTFEGGVLTIKHKPFANLDYGEERTKGIRKLLESKL